MPRALLNPNNQPPAGAAPQAPSSPPAAGTAPPQTPPAAPPAPQNATGLVSGAPGPAQAAYLAQRGGASQAAFQGYAADGDKAVQQAATLGNMLADTSQFTTGPGASTLKQFQATLQRISPALASKFGISPDAIAANESFNKLAAQLADAQGAGSDARLSVNVDANPHQDLSPAGADLVIRQLQGNADYKKAKAALASAYPDQTNSTAFEGSIRQNLDPRAFQFARLTPAQKVTYAQSLSKQDLPAVQSAYNWAVAHNLIGGPNAGQ